MFFLGSLLALLVMLSIGIFCVVLFALLNAPLVLLVVFSYFLARTNLASSGTPPGQELTPSEPGQTN